MNVEIEILADVALGRYYDMVRRVTLAYGQAIQQELMEDKPSPPPRGSMRFKSEKQRRFVMASIRKGTIKVPYQRGKGGGVQGSNGLNRSFRVDLEGDNAVLYSTASYAPYVIGDQQADIHKGRWKTATDAATTIAGRGDLEKIVSMALTDLEKM